MMEIAATERLRLRPLQADDLRAFVAYRSHPDVARYQSWDATYAMNDAEALLAAQADLAFGTPGAWVQVAALDRASGELRRPRPAVQNLFGRLGFRCEARQVEADWFKGEWTTVRVYAMLEREWRAGGRSSSERTAGIP
jgi:RimJ/RimL family protein N-acetyltransferase